MNPAIIARAAKIRSLEVAIGHVFSDKSLAWKSLLAAGITGESVQDGNKVLAHTGDVLLKLVIVEDMSKRGIERGLSYRSGRNIYINYSVGQTQITVSRIGSNGHLGAIGQRNGIDQLIVRNNSQRLVPPSPYNVATTIEAILAAVWHDTKKDIGAVSKVMVNLGVWPEV
jgi:dsRNA-specific ribonuclease